MFSYVLNAASSYVRTSATTVHNDTDVDMDEQTLIISGQASDLLEPHLGRPFSPSSDSSSSVSSSDSSSSASSSRSPSSSPPPSGASSPLGPTPFGHTPSSSQSRYSVIHDVLRQENLYEVLGIKQTSDVNLIRRAYMTRCKNCHPDKFPEYPLATLAFQKVSFAYDILSQSSSRRAYDKAGLSPRFSSSTTDANGNYYAHHAPDDTLNAVLYGVFCDFMEGDFEMIRTFLKAMGEINSKMEMGDDTIENLLNSFRKLREVLLAGQKYVRIIRFELIRMHEIQSSLRQLSYFDLRGRLRLTLQLARVTLSLPMVVDVAMREEEDAASSTDENAHEYGHGARESSYSTSSTRSTNSNPSGRPRFGRVNGRRKRGLIPPQVGAMMGLAIGALEMGERML